MCKQKWTPPSPCIVFFSMLTVFNSTKQCYYSSKQYCYSSNSAATVLSSSPFLVTSCSANACIHLRLYD
uniref:Secreted protein n=1 Tax=Arundo donax TaxID=35708 RepID=A0A0A9HLI6_ARUDO